MTKNISNVEWDNLNNPTDNTNHLLQMTNETKNILDDALNLSGEVLMKLTNIEALSVHRDWIADFIQEMKK